MSEKNILEEVVGLVPRKSKNEDGTEVISLILNSLVKYKPLALMSKTEEENLEFLDKDIMSRIDFLLNFCKHNVMFSEYTHSALVKVLKEYEKELESFIASCKKLSKEGKVTDLDFTLEYVHGFSILTCSVMVQNEIMSLKEFKACDS